MRAEFAQAMVKRHAKDDRAFFLTGDLGYGTLEEVQRTYGNRFLNAGVAEQNMMSVAAGLAHEGFVPWVYSIAPFCLLRPYEQIRNDICFHRLPVKIVGNGGGYGYGIMGATHHTLEDIAVMRVLPNMRVFVPLVASDVEETVEIMAQDPNPNYLRLNLSAKLPMPVEPFRAWRKIKSGTKGIVIGTGPVLGNLFDPELSALVDGLEIWHVGCFPVTELPKELLSSAKAIRKVLVMEEHSGQCGLNETIASLFLQKADFQCTMTSLHANGYPSGKFGDQKWHQEENDLAGQGLGKELESFFKKQGSLSRST